MPPKHRDVAPFLKKVREFLLGREHITSLRHADSVSPRAVVPSPEKAPVRLFDNPYYLRSARALVRPPVDVVTEHKRKMAHLVAKTAEPSAKAAKDATSTAKIQEADKVNSGDAGKDSKSNKLPTPGEIIRWD